MRYRVQLSCVTIYENKSANRGSLRIRKRIFGYKDGSGTTEETFRAEFKCAKASGSRTDTWEPLPWGHDWTTLAGAWQCIAETGLKWKETFLADLVPEARWHQHCAEWKANPNRVHEQALEVHAVREAVATLGAITVSRILNVGYHERDYLGREARELYNMPEIKPDEDEEE